MNRFSKTFAFSACALAATVLVSACGGGDAGAPFSPTASFGYAVDGYLKDASVKCDASGVVVRTDSAGFFRFPDGCSSSVSLTGGTNVDTLLPFTGMLKAPAGSKMVTPLTTLLVGGMTQEQINASLGLPVGTDLTNTDPALESAGVLVNADLLKKTLALHQLIMQTTEAMAAFAGDSSDATRQAIYSEIASAFAAGLKGGAKLNATSTTVDLAVLQTLVTDAGTRLAASTLVPPAVKSAISLVRADTFAAVISGGLKAQAEVLLGMANADVTTVTAAQQSDTKIKSAVTATGMSAILILSPTDAVVVAKATALTDAITGGGEVVEPPNTGAGTVLLNFDNLLPISAVGGEGGQGSGVVAGPEGGGTGDVYEVLRSGGTTYALAILETSLPLTTTRKTISAQVYSPTAGIDMVIKLEGAGVSTGDVQANEAVVQGWQTLTWTFATGGTATYTKMVLLPNLGNLDASPGKSYYFDDFKLLDAPVVPPQPTTGTVLLNFDNLLPISAVGGEGGQGSGVVAGPEGGGTGDVYEVLRSGGTTYALAILETSLPLTTTRKTISAQVYSPTAGIDMVIKLEGAGVSTGDVQANEAVVQGWQTLTWTFATGGTATYTKMVLLPNLGNLDASPGKSYYFDDFKLLDAAGGGGSNGGGTATSGSINFEANGRGAAFTWSSFENGSNDPIEIVPNPNPSDINTSAVVAKFTALKAGQPWAGFESKHGLADGTGSDLGTITLSAANALIKMKVYKSVLSDVGVKLAAWEGASQGEVKTPNTVTGAWQELSFNFCNKLGTPVIDQVIVFPDFNLSGRSADTVNYIDDITFNPCP